MLIKQEISLSCFDTQRTLHIYLPNDYNETTDEYDVLYMYDGHNLFQDCDATYGKSWGIAKFLDEHQAKLIVIGIECNHEGYSRLSEFSPYTYYDTIAGPIEGKGDVLMKWVVEKLIPMIEMTYRVKKGRDHRGIAGSSMGGLMSLYTILQHNDEFKKAACVSTHTHGLMKFLRKEAKKAIRPDTDIYISWGAKEVPSKTALARFNKGHLDIINDLIKNHINIDINFVVNGRHCEADWEKELPRIFKFLYQIEKLKSEQ